MRIMFVRMKTIALVLVFTAALCLGVQWLMPDVAASLTAERLMPVRSVYREYKTAALTFDLSGSGDDALALMYTLDEYGVLATFFITGEWAGLYPDVVRTLAADGHEVMSRGGRQTRMTNYTGKQISESLKASSDIISALTGTVPSLFRPPYGDYDDKLISAAREAGYEPVLWNIDSLDWKGLSAAKITKRVISKLEPGSIVLFQGYSEALPDIINQARQAGYRLETVGTMMHQGVSTVDRYGVQRPKADIKAVSSDFAR